MGASGFKEQGRFIQGLIPEVGERHMRRFITNAKVILTVIGEEEVELKDEEIILACELMLNDSQVWSVPEQYTGKGFQIGLRFHLGLEE
jgi:hypothetical protein